MVEKASFYGRLSTKEGFNASVRHINRTLDLLDACGPKKNIADEINRLLTEKQLEAEQVQSAVNMLLVEKWGYRVVSRNISTVSSQAGLVAEETAKWKAVDLVIGYHHPDLGFIVLNPKNPESAAVIADFRKNELLVLFAGTQDKTAASDKNAEAALSCLFDLLEDKKVKAPAALLSGPYAFQAPKKAPRVKENGTVKGKTKAASKTASRSPAVVAKASAGYAQTAQVAIALPAAVPVAAAPVIPGQSKITPLISVVVSNELFHNGNVEAWKRIIRSFNAKYPGLQVSIYYDGERIIDINTLFKWGKVKHGSCIQFRVAGENIQDLAKLSRYFKQGASSQYEAFLHGSPDTVMNLF